MAGEIIRLGDPTSHGGKVIEGSLADICHGKPIAFIGHRTFCPQCKGMFPIIEGAPTTTFYGKGVALAGMKTACGAVLIATQMTDVVQLGGGTDQGRASGNTRSAFSQKSDEQREPSYSIPSPQSPAQVPELEQYFEAVDGRSAAVDIVYRINAGAKKLVESTLSDNGATQAFPLDEEAELIFWKAPR
jgi:uncharacterized Zn-binding protein involved in type VI secretion